MNGCSRGGCSTLLGRTRVGTPKHAYRQQGQQCTVSNILFQRILELLRHFCFGSALGESKCSQVLQCYSHVLLGS